MNCTHGRSLKIALACAAFAWVRLASIGSAQAAEPTAQNWPVRPITLVVPYPAGGATDGVSRLLARDLSEKLGQNVLVENRTGGAGNIGALTVAKAAPDGYRLLLFSAAHATSKLLYKNLGFDAQADLAPIVLVGSIPQVIVVSDRVPVKTLAEFVSYARARPGLSVGNSGTGTSAHLAAVIFARQTGLTFNHIAYRGTAPLVTDILGAQIDLGMPGYFPQASEGNVLAVTAPERLAALPSVPTVAETGVADVRVGLWFGLAAPAGTPDEIVARINATVNAFLGSQTMRDAALTLGMQPLGGSPEKMRAKIVDEIERLGPVLKDANIKVE